ncbi:zinc finger FYVE domain-containing protein 21-like isoform X2 [Amphiura filiformis]|uniref:zinc finger FYVE domain-containing protein 21-like isoform X2 n=1 Tax=Amphiura filiformis TaxID=82378 RepID=UPI003B21F843
MANSGKKLVRSKSGLRMVSVEDKDTSPFQLEEPPWIPDNQCISCQNCNAKYDIVKRRHHCRRCGRCYCGTCCSTKLPLPRMNFVDPVRLCAECVSATRKENEFYEKHLKTLINGGSFTMQSSSLENGSAYTYCQLSPNHRNLIFNTEKPDKENNRVTQWVCDPMSLISIEGVQIQTIGDPNQAITIRYKYIDELREVTMMVPEDNTRKQSMTWIIAMQKAVKMLHSSQSNTNNT